MKASISAWKENRRRQLKEPYEEKDPSARWGYWLVLRSVISQLNGLFCSLEERKEISCCLWLVICCLTSNAYYAAGLRFINDQIVEDDFWFEDFFLLVIDVIKQPGTYFDNWL